MRSIWKFLSYFLFIGVLTSIMIVTTKNQTALAVGQLIIFTLTLILIFRVEKKTLKREEDLKKEVEKIDDIDCLRERRKKTNFYQDKVIITKRILELDYSKEETEILKSYISKSDDMTFYYARLIQNERDDREIYKKKRDTFNKAYANKVNVYPDFKANIKMFYKRLIFFTACRFLFYFRVFSFLNNKVLGLYCSQMLFIILIGDIINIAIRMVRAGKAHALADTI